MTAEWLERDGTILHTTDALTYTAHLVVTFTVQEVVAPGFNDRLADLAIHTLGRRAQLKAKGN